MISTISTIIIKSACLAPPVSTLVRVGVCLYTYTRSVHTLYLFGKSIISCVFVPNVYVYIIRMDLCVYVCVRISGRGRGQEPTSSSSHRRTIRRRHRLHIVGYFFVSAGRRGAYNTPTI